MQREYRSIDARLLLLSFVFTAFLLWSMPLAYVSVFFLVYTIFYFYQVHRKKRELFFYKNLLLFSFFWFVSLVLVQSVQVESFRFSFFLEKEYVFFAMHYILKICVLALLGLNIFILASPKEYALALVYFASFFSKENAWKVGLITLLILKYFYEFFALMQTMLQVSSHRIKKRLSIQKRVYYFCQAFIRILANKNYSLSIALYSRGFNDKKAFEKNWESIFCIENIKDNMAILSLNLVTCIICLYAICS